MSGRSPPSDDSGHAELEPKPVLNSVLAASKTIESVFTKLAGILEMKNRLKPNYALTKDLDSLHDHFLGTVANSKALASTIADYGRRSEEILMLVCNDLSLSVAQRKVRMEGFIASVHQFYISAGDINDNLTKRVDELLEFMRPFKNWGFEKGSKQPVINRQGVANGGDALKAFWAHVRTLLTQSESYLKHGMELCDVPKYLMTTLQQVIQIYTMLADALKEYANIMQV